MSKQSTALLAGFILFFLSSLAFAKDSSKGIVVWQLETKGGASQANVDLISGFVAAEVEKYSDRHVISEADIQTILKGEGKKQQCGVDNTGCIAEIGAALGVPEAVSGELGHVAGFWMLNLRRINVRKATVTGRSSRQVEGLLNELIRMIPEAVAELFGKKIEAPLTGSKGTLKVDSDPQGAEVFIKGESIGKTPLKITLLPGSYEIRLVLEDHEDAAVSGEVLPNETKAVKLELQKIVVAMSPYQIGAYSSFFSGVALVVFGGVSSWQAGEAKDTYNASRGADSDAESAHAMWKGMAITGYVVGGAAMATGIALWIVDSQMEPDEELPTVGIAPSRDGFSAGLAWRW